MEQLPIPDIYISSICEIKTLENELLATGIITDITQEYIQINDKSASMMVARYGTMVKVNVFNYRHGFRVLIGKVYISTAQFVRVMEVTNLLDYERRNFFRVGTALHAKVALQDPGQDAERIFFDVTVQDLSLGGTMFTTDDVIIAQDEPLYLRIKFGHLSTEIPCTVRRIQMENGKREYGCEFDQITDAQNGALCAYIFQRQREQINQNRR